MKGLLLGACVFIWKAQNLSSPSKKRLVKMAVVLLSSMFVFSAPGVELRIYGGESHDVFLGLLNGSKYDSDSIWNAYGDHGSKYNDKCIWNKYGNYGGAYSNTSPFNQYASDPPVIVDIEGNFYGYLTVNKYKDKRAEFRLAYLVCLLWEKAYDDLDAVYESVQGHLNLVVKGQSSRSVSRPLPQQSPTSVIVAAPKPQSRIWTDYKGGRVSARLVSVSDDETTFSLVSDKTGKTIQAKFYKLSKDDQAYLRSEAKSYKQAGYVLKNGWWVKYQTNGQQNIKTARTAPRTDRSVVNLEGCLLYANDGTFLGKITWNDVDSDSIFNSVGSYGSDVSLTSIWNDVSQYGSDVSTESAFNDVAMSPPRIIRNGELIGYLTINVAKPGAISPKCLLNVIGDDADEIYLKKLHGLRR